MEAEIKTKEKKIIKEKLKKIIARAKYIRISPKKIRLVINVIRGMGVDEAKNQLKFIPKKACQSVLELLNSAIANAKHNFDLKKENLYIKEIIVNQGATLDRWMPRAFGRAAPIRKRTSHITITLDEKEKNIEAQSEKLKAQNKEAKEQVKKEAPLIKGVGGFENIETQKQENNETDAKQTETQNFAFLQKKDKMNFKSKHGFVKKMFQRKSG